MKSIRILLVAFLAVPAAPALAAEDDDGWSALGHALTLIQTLVRINANSDHPQQGIDDVLAGRDPQASRAMAGLLEEATSDMPAQHKASVAAIGLDLAALARRNLGKAPAAGPVGAEAALQARKDLHAMGLSYHDEKQFLDAVRRDDALAIELFLAARGLQRPRNLPAER